MLALSDLPDECSSWNVDLDSGWAESTPRNRADSRFIARAGSEGKNRAETTLHKNKVFFSKCEDRLIYTNSQSMESWPSPNKSHPDFFLASEPNRSDLQPSPPRSFIHDFLRVVHMSSSRRLVRFVSSSLNASAMNVSSACSLPNAGASQVKRSRLCRYIGLLAAPSLAALALTNGLAPTTYAANYYWDIDGNTAGAGGATPSGTWDGVGSVWSTNLNGTIATSPYTTVLADDLFFSAGVNATGAYTISLTSPQNARSLNFQEGTATISGRAAASTWGAPV